MKCPRCEFNHRAHCRNCGEELTSPKLESDLTPKVIERIVERVRLKSVPVFSFEQLAVLPTIEQAEMLLILEAVRRTPTYLEASKLIGMGKTTLYRKMRDYGITAPRMAEQGISRTRFAPVACDGRSINQRDPGTGRPQDHHHVCPL